MPLLEVREVGCRFGGVVALDSVSFTVEPGRIKALIGPNGAGKTTMFNVVSGALRPDAGCVLFAGRPITGLPPHRVSRLGIARTFQNLSLFARMSALENVMVGRHGRTREGFTASALRRPRQRREERVIRERAMADLRFVGLEAAAAAPVAELSFGQRRMVELARALAAEPRLLLLDEPAAGLNTRETDDLARLICRLRDRGITVLLVEHDMSLVMDISDEVLVLNYGTPIAAGSPAEVRNHPAVVSVYLGDGFRNA